ncbi:This family includes the FlgN protein and export chaperone involved in flagellar synthesis [Hartmannibacter diazotrophicus]|uniref:This family includes the FlgN protein and export chaperone involved in flagellar synthesis n=1 Tax=Hartmannibacter diazotrophicus TaxID=1482074 RepID=A0A2C9D7B8_9HYPH|nr:flagellar protein FlgN [Hartmannibacter diazotrophicus]SON56224.1 This family includes the FlgN protein and export chaperone involved in flagellar synthesis [Hartmannibacter diazotrophicus]
MTMSGQDRNGQSPRYQPITSSSDAQNLIAAFSNSMTQLSDLLEREADLVRSGKLKAAGELASVKQEMAGTYVNLMLETKAQVEKLGQYAPVQVQKLRKQHHLFKANLQVNMAVIATAHEIAEDLMRQTARAVEKTNRPQLYGAPMMPQSARAADGACGIAFDQSL